jgi:hypothetical protein
MILIYLMGGDFSMKRLGITLVILSLLVFFGMAYAAEQKGESEKSGMSEKQALASAVKVPMAAALATASKQVAGTVLAAEVENEDGKTMYCFEIMPTPTSAIVKEVKIDAITGALIGTEDENAEKETSEKTAEFKEAKKSEKNEKWSKGEKDEKEGEFCVKGEKGERPIIFQFFINGEKAEKGEKSEKGAKEMKPAKEMKATKAKASGEKENEKDEKD